jgi:hypothetical protein
VADPTSTQLLPQEKLAEDLDAVEEALANLQILYEKYFLGIDRKPPDQERKRVSVKLRELKGTFVKNTGLKFRIQSLWAKLISFERMWDRTLREIEEGTYKRDVFKAKYRQARKFGPEAAKVPAAAPEQPKLELSDGKLRRLFDTYLVARQRTGEPTEGLTYEAIAERIRAQVPLLLQQHKAKSVEFKVVIKAGKAVLKAIPHL